MFTARNRQNPFAKRRRAQRAAEQPTAAPFDRNSSAPDYEQAPDIAAYEPSADAEPKPEPTPAPGPPSPSPEISPETQAKIDAVVNRAVPPVAEAVESAAPAEVLPKDEPVTTTETDTKRGRGRPRPQATIARDNAVHELLTKADPAEGIAKEAIATALGEKEQQVYSSLRQLSKEGRAETRYVKPHGYRWFAV